MAARGTRTVNRVRQQSRAGATVVLVGLGNIGSQCVAPLARMKGVSRLILVDRDTYEMANLQSQDISRRDVGKPKAIAQATRARLINPALDVAALVDDLAMIPPGRLKGDVILTGLDSIEARLQVSEIAWRLGVPWLDAGIEPVQRLVRITGYLPTLASPCFACGLDEAEYRNLGARHPCQAQIRRASPTNGPIALGAIAANLLATECEKILADDFAHALLGRQLVIDTRHHRHFVTTLHRNCGCRFDHSSWRLADLPVLAAKSSIGALLVACRRAAKGESDTWIKLENWPMAREAHCPRCSGKIERLHVVRRPLRCPHCGANEMRAIGFALLDRLDRRTPPALLRQSLRHVGIFSGDVVRVTSGKRVRHLVISREKL